MTAGRLPFDDRPSFVQRTSRERPDTLQGHASRVSRRQPTLPIFAPPPPHTLHGAEPPPAPPRAPPLSSGEKAKARDILAAIRTLKDVERSGQITDDQRDILSRFGGFGAVALSIFPDPKTGAYKPGWEEIGKELESLLTPREYESAKRTTFSQFFTAPAVMEAMHSALERLGTPEDATILEPGCGSGAFLAHAKPSQRLIGVELDSLSGRIARALHPMADIRIESFRDSKLPPLDAVIGNVPFGDVKLDFKGDKLSLHNFFIAKSVDSLKPGGVLAVVTSHFTLDQQNAAVREKLAEQADFLGAIRLPSDAFKREGTAVVTDILFLRKRDPGQEPQHADADWLHAAPLTIEGADVPINRYFHEHPEMVLGDWSRQDTLHGAAGYSVKSNGDLPSQLRLAIARLPAVEQSRAEQANPPPETLIPPRAANPLTDHGNQFRNNSANIPFTPPPPLRHIAEGSFFVDNRRLFQLEDGQSRPVVYGGTELREDGTMTGRRIAGLIGLRDKARRVLQSQNEGWPESNRNEARRELNWAYDRFTRDYGPINKTSISETKEGTTIRRMPNLVKFREDPDAMLVMALEEYDEATGTAEKSAIMKRDVVGPKPPVSRVTTAEEGLLVSLDHKGAVDLAYISSLYGKPEAAIAEELGDLIYKDPETKSWQTADQYLSGNVRQKLAEAEHAGQEYARNAAALKAVQPEDVLPGDIDANLGAPWIPAEDIRAFAEELFEGKVAIGHLKKEALWSVEADYRAAQSVAATADYGTPRMTGISLFEAALNLRAPVIYDIVMDGDRETRVVNPEATLAAKEKQKLIKEKFKAWVFSDPDRTERLVRIYNDIYNNLRPRIFDGSHLDFPGMSKAITLNPHQEDGAWRCMSGGNTLLAHSVGAGKAQPLDAKILTPTGWVNLGDVKAGDQVIAGDGTVTEVTGIYPQGIKPVFRLALSDGASTRACGEHLWLTQTSKERLRCREAKSRGQYSIKGQPRIRTTDELARSLDQRHMLPVMGAAHLPRSDLPLDPYTLGVLLGNACFTLDSIQLAIPEAVQLDLLSLPEGVTTKTWSKPGKCPVAWLVGGHVRPNPLSKIIRELGLWKHKSREKFIPGPYLWADTDSRLGLLQGLMDTDGCMTGRSTRFTSYSRQLGEDVLALARSLGGLARIHERPGASPGSLRYDVDMKLPAGVPPFRLPRKLATWQERTMNLRSMKRYLVSVEPEGEQECRCISVAHPSRLYVTDDFIVTHNTYTMAAAGMKMKQAGLCKKPMYCIANNMLEQFSREFLHLYPNAKLLVATKEDMTKERRKMLTAKIASGEWDGIIVTHSGFERIGMSKEYQERFLREQIAEYEDLLISCAGEGRNVLKQIEKGKARREERLKELLAEDKKDSGLVFDELGIDQLFVDESAMSFKNLETPTKMDRVAGIQTTGSERAFDLFMKCRYLDEKHPGHGVVFATGTPITNTMVEMYTNQRFLDPKGLSDRGIEHFDGWAATFGEVVDSMEISPDGATLKPRARFAKFNNVPELVQMFRSFADVQTAEMLDLPRPALAGGKPQTVSCPMSEEQAELQAALVKRYERIRNERVDPREDNALSITTDGRKLALDARMLDGSAPDYPGSKVNALAANVARIHRETTPKRGTQLVFCDMGVNANPFSAYDDVVSKLELAGIPRKEIAVIGDADTDAKKQALFEKVRSGSVRVLLGSTQKMGTGTNVQKRLVALHHLDAPWKPAEVEQREGRILRQGNTNPEVSIFRYVTEGSFDAYMWQALETKARFIAQVMRGDCGARSAEDIGGQELSYAEVKAIASGNPAVLTLAESDAEMQRLAVLRRNHADEQYLAKRNVRDLPDTIDRLEKRIAGLAEDQTTAETGASDSMERIARALERVPDKVDHSREYALGTYKGLKLGLIAYPFGGCEVTLGNRVMRRDGASSHGVRAVINAAERIVASYGYAREETATDLDVARGKLRDYEDRLGKPFAHEAYMSQLSDLRDRLKLALSDHPPEGELPSSEIAGKIQALRASVTVEEAPKREARVSTAEVPVTRRIRKKPQHPPEEVAVDPIPGDVPVQPKNEPIILPAPPAFRQQVTERRGKANQMTMW